MTVQSNLKKELLKVGFMAKDEADAYMELHDLTFLKICETAEDAYRNALDNGRWPPASNVPDAKKPPGQFANIANVAMTKQGAYVLLQNSHGQNNNGNKGVCFECGSPDHYKRDCPKLAAAKTTAEMKAKNGQQGTGGGSNGTSPKKPARWNRKAPAPGQQKVMQRNGKTYYWCEKCKRWNTTHKTETHVRKNGSKTQQQQQQAQVDSNLAFVEDPSWWNVSVQQGQGYDGFTAYLPLLLLGFVLFAPSFVSCFTESMQWWTQRAMMLGPQLWTIGQCIWC